MSIICQSRKGHSYDDLPTFFWVLSATHAAAILRASSTLALCVIFVPIFCHVDFQDLERRDTHTYISSVPSREKESFFSWITVKRKTSFSRIPKAPARNPPGRPPSGFLAGWASNRGLLLALVIRVLFFQGIGSVLRF